MTAFWPPVNLGSISVPRYRLISDGTNVSAFDQTGTILATGTDGGAVLTAILPSASSVGATIDFRNDGYPFPWASVPKIAPRITNKLLISGNGALIVLSASGSRFLDLAGAADHDTFQNIEVVDFNIDATNAGAVNQHTVIGSVTPVSSQRQRININNLTVRRIYCFGIPTTGTRRGISLATSQLAGGEATQNYIKNILIQDVIIDGGQIGIGITGAPSGAITNLNILFDNILIERCKHLQSSQTVIGAPGTAANFQIGQNAPGGTLTIRDCYGEYSGDVGVEIDNGTFVTVEDVVISNSFIGYLVTNFANPNQPNAQNYSFRRCKTVVTDVNVVAGNLGWLVQKNNSLALGSFIFEGCVFQQNNNVFGTGINTTPVPFSFGTAATIRAAAIRDCQVNIESINWNNASPSNPVRAVYVNGPTIGLFKIDGLDVRFSGTQSGAGVFVCRAFELSGGNVILHADSVNVDFNISGMGAAGSMYAFFFGSASGSTIGGSIRRLNIVSLGSDTAARVIRFGATSNLTISAPPFFIEDCNFAAFSGTIEILVDATQSALGAVLTKNNVWKTKPVPIALTGLVTATGMKLGAAGATWPCIAQFIQGSGAAITALDYSTNAGTTYTNLLTQASAALPAGVGPLVGPLVPSDLIKTTFTTTQPTVTLVPVNP